MAFIKTIGNNDLYNSVGIDNFEQRDILGEIVWVDKDLKSMLHPLFLDFTTPNQSNLCMIYFFYLGIKFEVRCTYFNKRETPYVFKINLSDKLQLTTKEKNLVLSTCKEAIFSFTGNLFNNKKYEVKIFLYSFHKTQASPSLIKLLVRNHKHNALKRSEIVYYNAKHQAALLPIPFQGEYHFSLYPFELNFRFYIYSKIFKVKFGTTKLDGEKDFTTIFNILIPNEFNLTIYQKNKLIVLCKKAVYCYIGDDYLSRPYQIRCKTV